ncbi:MAG: hypothetical protein LBT46_12980 [Planctomycetaceae bacterium]|jgi:hypothetical protein|nr:hypothetical protein [Planctomycetaceae bacterium]
MTNKSIRLTQRLFAAAVMLASFGFFPVTVDARTWKSANGKFSIQADFIELDAGNNVILKNEDGKKFPVPLDKLASEDRSFVKRQVAKKNVKNESENEDTEAAAKKPLPEKKAGKKPAVTLDSIQEELEAEIEKIENGKDKADKKQTKINDVKIEAGKKILKHLDTSADRAKGYELQIEGLIAAAKSGKANAEKELRALAEKGMKDKKLSMQDKKEIQQKFMPSSAPNKNGSGTAADEEEKEK